jgi:hypothetical protein
MQNGSHGRLFGFVPFFSCPGLLFLFISSAWLLSFVERSNPPAVVEDGRGKFGGLRFFFCYLLAFYHALRVLYSSVFYLYLDLNRARTRGVVLDRLHDRTACDGIDNAEKGVAYIAYTPQQCIMSKLLCQSCPSSAQLCSWFCIGSCALGHNGNACLCSGQAAPTSFRHRRLGKHVVDMEPVNEAGRSGPEIRVGPDHRPSNVISGPKLRRQEGQNIKRILSPQRACPTPSRTPDYSS